MNGFKQTVTSDIADLLWANDLIELKPHSQYMYMKLSKYINTYSKAALFHVCVSWYMNHLDWARKSFSYQVPSNFFYMEE